MGLPLVCALTLVLSNVPESVIPRTATNCALDVPPERSGEDFSHGLEARIFPRLAELPARYNGCQSQWLRDHDRWVKLSSTYIDGGQPTGHESYDEKGVLQISCRYKKTRLVAGPLDSCPAFEVLLLHSLPPGCVSKIQGRPKSGALPKGCEYDLQARAR
jgi:hypothetical protein